jgi:hypothetical protein
MRRVENSCQFQFTTGRTTVRLVALFHAPSTGSFFVSIFSRLAPGPRDRHYPARKRTFQDITAL